MTSTSFRVISMIRPRITSFGGRFQRRSKRSYASQILHNVLPLHEHVLWGCAMSAIVWLLLCTVITLLQCAYYKKIHYPISSLMSDCEWQLVPLSCYYYLCNHYHCVGVCVAICWIHLDSPLFIYQPLTADYILLLIGFFLHLATESCLCHLS